MSEFPTDFLSEDVDKADALQKSLMSFMQGAKRHCDVAFALSSTHGHCPNDKWTWHALYTSLWGNIKTLPTMIEGTTMLGAPDLLRVEATQLLLSAGKYEQAASSAAMLVPTAPCCLDLHEVMATSLVRLGAPFADALSVLEQHVLAFVTSFEGIESLLFADGTPFATATTLSWLEGLRINATKSKSVESEDSCIAVFVDTAAALASQNQLAKALSCLHEAHAKVTPAERLRLQMAEIRLLVQYDRADVASLLAQNIVQLLDTHDLYNWDTKLCEDALVAAYKAWICVDVNTARNVAQRLATINPARALSVVGA